MSAGVSLYQGYLLGHRARTIVSPNKKNALTIELSFKVHSVQKACRYLQVILRPSPSTSGRSDQHRLFLRQPKNKIALRRLSGPYIPGKQSPKGPAGDIQQFGRRGDDKRRV